MLGLNEFQAKSDAERLWIKIFNKAVKMRSENRQCCFQFIRPKKLQYFRNKGRIDCHRRNRKDKYKV